MPISITYVLTSCYVPGLSISLCHKHILTLFSFALIQTAEKSAKEEEDSDNSDNEDAEEKPKTKTEKKTIYEWELLNDSKAIWLRSPKDVTEEEYTKFYKSLAKDFSDEKPSAWTHFNAEGDVEFKAVLFIPPRAPYDLYEGYYDSTKANLKLYVRRVFISDEFDELLPKYLSFLKVSFQSQW